MMDNICATSISSNQIALALSEFELFCFESVSSFLFFIKISMDKQIF